MLRRIILVAVLLVISSTSFGQNISPTQLLKLFTLWQTSSGDKAIKYLNAIDVKWQPIEEGTISTSEQSRYMFKNHGSSTTHSAFTLISLRGENKIVDKVYFMTDNIQVIEQYFIFVKKLHLPVVSHMEEPDGARRRTYKNGNLYYIIIAEPKTEKGIIIYTFSIHGVERN